jgi:hypothetical protein
MCRAFNKPWVATIAAVLLGTVGGCYRWYTGIYFVEAPGANVSISIGQLGAEIAEAVYPFGLRSTENTVASNSVTFSGRGTTGIAPEFVNLNGAGASITVTVTVEKSENRFAPFYISIRDFSSHDETDFMRALKRHIEQRIAERNGVTIKFERQSDMFL